jgi:nitrite reductase/ring-hydroxylating ferredoxin subunit
MLSREENELLTRTGPGTSMGELFRRFWLPAMLATELPEPDCPPVRVRLLGEDLVAFRDTAGTVALLPALCAHRGAPLFFGRNEEYGLRCIYHGWKYDVAGHCVAMPNEPAESDFKHKIRLTAYPVREAGGVLWTYMGSPDRLPAMPELEWTLVPPSHCYVSKRIQECNYLQNLEGELDSSHVSFLHRRFNLPIGGAESHQAAAVTEDTAPRFTVLNTDYGLLVGASRDAGDDSYYWRITQYLLPTYTMIPSPPGSYLDCTVTAPIDDENMVGFTIAWRPDEPLTPADIERIESWTSVHTEVDPRTFKPLRNKANDYLVDRQAQRTESFSGIRGIREQDLAVQENMGAIYDRTQEHLGTSDTAIIAMRRRLLKTVRELQAGKEPYEAQHGEIYRVRSAIAHLNRDVPFHEGAKERLIARV